VVDLGLAPAGVVVERGGQAWRTLLAGGVALRLWPRSEV
jgi:hypothetical protein